jgi:peptide/nickel transport system permease protein
LASYIIRRFLDSVIVLILVSLLVFFAMRLLPGDPMYILVSKEEAGGMSPAQIEQLRQEHGLDKPIFVQYFSWVADVAHGDLGVSIVSDISVKQKIANRAPITLYMGAIAWIISAVLGIAAGLVCAVKRGKTIDTVVTSLANLGITIPSFWLGFLLVFILGIKLHLLPVFGFTSPFENFAMSTKQMIMPIICLSIGSIAGITRQTRSSMLEIIKQDYIRTAWAKGLRERSILIRHVLKNGLIPVVTVLGMHVRSLFGGAVLVETVFNISGMGRLAADAVFAQDYPVVQGVTLIMAIIVLIANFIVDISYGWLDPRIKYA